MPKLNKNVPSYRLHKPSGRTVMVRIVAILKALAPSIMGVLRVLINWPTKQPIPKKNPFENACNVIG